MSKPVPLCTHTMPDGHLCASPALRGRRTCYHHDPNRRERQPLRRVAAATPSLDTVAGIQHVLRDAIRLSYQGKLDNRRARNVVALADRAVAIYKAQHRFANPRTLTRRSVSAADTIALIAALEELSAAL
jgi:hypothetical protein